MHKVMNVEKRIWDVEGFAVQIQHPDGRDVRGDKGGLPDYDYRKAAKHNMTVSAWKDTRFAPTYSDFNVVVFYGDGSAAPGMTQLGTVRDSYSEED